MCESGLRHQKYFQDYPRKSNYPFKINVRSDSHVLSRPRLSVEIRMSLGTS
ncbi:Uncharacterised protein [Klebsiella pneumoniae]|nr:Uncharacterised protein [Klebsiella pneumoniae]